MAVADSLFPQRLKSGFVEKYNEAVGDGLVGDDIFEMLVDFSAGGSTEIKRQCAGLAILAYMFEKCEVFAP
jgi:hypothetical protein